MAAMLYATDGQCHNAEPGTYGHECGKPATWLGAFPSGMVSGFCSDCKARGTEARQCIAWITRPADVDPAALERWGADCTAIARKLGRLARAV